MNPIYKPKGKAAEYCEYALNIYTECNHGCTYCWARDMAKRFGRPWTGNVKPRKGIVEATKRQLDTWQVTGKLINLCFTCDPYPCGCDTSVTQQVIQAIKESGNHVQILTKSGMVALRDFDLLSSNDWFGVTYTGGLNGVGCKNDYEPNAAPDADRLLSLNAAHELGIKTWVSCEPVTNESGIYLLLKHYDYIDLYRIGKLNYYPSDINWKEFGNECVRLCEEHGRNYYIKHDLRKEMEA